ncbi:hypothetical protein ElyMa_005888000 [Elysia marginata]|uniref:Ion transport domain-containing protein n=1 Tax=Elysia marginata TaxID=1093978 RepID=A0AAV4G4T2_9GAST|nr:hypothetical protein ElyMa_005888000 [Elysia marginata]
MTIGRWDVDPCVRRLRHVRHGTIRYRLERLFRARLVLCLDGIAGDNDNEIDALGSELAEHEDDDDNEEEEPGFIDIGKKKAPPKRAVRAPVVFYRTADNQLRRVYRNRCERYCLGPLGIFVDAIGTFVLTVVNLVLLLVGAVPDFRLDRQTDCWWAL